MKKLFVIIGLAVLFCSCQGIQMSSPDNRIQVQQIENENGTLALNVYYTNDGVKTEVIQIPAIGMLTKAERGKGMKLQGITQQPQVVEHYTMITGKRRENSNVGNEYLLQFIDSLGEEVGMRIRIYNDGIAFRYEFNALKNDKISDELTTYRIAEGTKRWMQRYSDAYEAFFPLSETGESRSHHWGYPALIQAGDNVFTLISEADIDRKQSASSLKNEKALADFKVSLALNEQELTGDWHSPWRVLIIGSLKELISSTLITDVSRPCTWEDTSWIQPGSVSWIYWAYNHGSRDFQRIKQYIDMAATLKLPYMLIDAEWDEMGNGGKVEDALRYAKEKGVRIMLWYNSSTAWINGAGGPKFKLNTPEDREKEFAWLAEQGVSGIKIDFFEGDTEPTMAYCQDLLEAAARHKLLVNFHGATIPRGWQRTYPNLMTVEAVYGAEWYNNNGRLTNQAAAHNATLPFTRNIIGPMDYTPCTFSDSQHPHITSHAHELALAPLYETGLLHWADKPESYLAQPEEVQTFMGELPTVWDETILIDGYPGDYVIMARRNGKRWYVAALNGTDNERTLTMDWSFLQAGKYKVTLFEDSNDKSNPWNISQIETDLTKFPQEFNCQPRGGFVAVINP